nr:MAG TPA: hypothetical protein [Caudoviricetes sp.]
MKGGVINDIENIAKSCTNKRRINSGGCSSNVKEK